MRGGRDGARPLEVDVALELVAAHDAGIRPVQDDHRVVHGKPEILPEIGRVRDVDVRLREKADRAAASVDPRMAQRVDVVNRGEIGRREVMAAPRSVRGRAVRERAPPGKRVKRQHARDPPCEAQREARRPHVRDANPALEKQLVKLCIEGALHVCDAAGEDESSAARGRVLDFETVARQPVAQRRDVRLRGAEALLELRGKEPPSKVRRDGILLVGEQPREDFRVPMPQDEEDAIEAGVAVESRDVAGAGDFPRDLADGRKDFVRPRAERPVRREQEQDQNGRTRRGPSGAAAAEEIDRPRHARDGENEKEADRRDDEERHEWQENRDEALQEREDVLREGEPGVRDARGESGRREARGALHEMRGEGDRSARPGRDDVQDGRPLGLDHGESDQGAHDGPDERVEEMPEMVEPRNLVGEKLHEEEDRRHTEGRSRGEQAGDRAGIILGKETRHRSVYEQHGIGVEARRRRQAEAGAEELGKSVRHRLAFAEIS